MAPLPDPTCRCEARLAGSVLVVDARDCPGGADLSNAPGCRATVVTALAGQNARAIRAESGENRYGPGVVALLVAAGRFADAVADRDERLARLARLDPRGAARRATARGGPVADLAAETGLAVVADGLGGTWDPSLSVDRSGRGPRHPENSG